MTTTTMIPMMRPNANLVLALDFVFFELLAATPTAWKTVKRKARDVQTMGFMSESYRQKMRRGTFRFCRFIWPGFDIVGGAWERKQKLVLEPGNNTIVITVIDGDGTARTVRREIRYIKPKPAGT